MRKDLFEVNEESIFIEVSEIDFDTVELCIFNHDQDTQEYFELEKIDCFNKLALLHVELTDTMIQQLEWLSFQRDDQAYDTSELDDM